jgi:chitin disaccharide deacetylase
VIRNATRLIVNADDLGFVESVNRGIIEAIERGIVTSASLMVNMPGRDDAIRRLGELLGRRDGAPPSVGLHLNIVAGRPLDRCGTLTHPRTGEFLPVLALAWRAWAGRLDPRDIERELNAQLQRARDLLNPIGLDVTHIDSHRHAHCLPGVFELVAATARREGITHVRHTSEARGAHLGRPHAMVAARLLRALVGRHAPLDDVRFTGVAMMRSRTFDRDIAKLIASLPSGTTELMVHPGYDSPELAAIDGYRAPRERELRALTSPELRGRIEAMGVELTRFSVPAAGATAATGRSPTREEPAAS